MGYVQPVQKVAGYGIIPAVTNRWAMLWLLFAARMVMALQFQAIGALSPALIERFGVGLGDIGIAIGLYFASGIVLAVFGGTIAARFGERRVSGLALGLMAIGGAVMAFTDQWSVFLAGQVIAGAGGVVVNVSMTKMVADLFQGKDIATALSLFINSWPVGIALSLVLMPVLAFTLGLSGAIAIVALLAAVMAVLVPLLYRPATGAAAPQRGAWPDGRALRLALTAGLIWGCFNTGIAVVFSFGTALLTDLGTDPDAAARRVSLVMWALAIVAPLGGWLSDRSNRPHLLISGGLVALFGLTLAVPWLQGAWGLMVLIGAAAGLVAGPIMSLPAQSLPAEFRAIGMGLFFTIYYVAFIIVPPVAGWVADRMDGGAFLIGGAMHVLSLAALAYFAHCRRSEPA